ncbi:MAG: exodeoxyribonuclease VII small subunit [Deltaproteobacteria bacterium]|nr:exodeoxyribonuclease VII small subunit [Deltaproteobacteria bacterium]
MAEKKTFENSMSELEGVVKKLEGGDISLDASLTEFEKGIKLVRECENKLDDAKGKIEKLVKDAGGDIKVTSFEPK